MNEWDKRYTIAQFARGEVPPAPIPTEEPGFYFLSEHHSSKYEKLKSVLSDIELRLHQVLTRMEVLYEIQGFETVLKEIFKEIQDAKQ